MKDTYYFPHDYHAIKDPKCSALIKDFGMTGYGLYWCIIEIMHEQGGKLKKFPKLIEGIAFELRVETKQLQKQIEAMIQEYNLLQEDDNFIWSNRVLKNLEERQKKYLIKAEAGRLGGIKSGKSRRIMKQNEAVLEANELKERKGKERKGKESNKYGDKSPVNKKPMYNEPVIELDELGEELPPKRIRTTFGKYPALIAGAYCKLMGKSSASRQLPAAKELMALAQKDFPEETMEQWYKEILDRIKVAKRYYDLQGVEDWNLSKVAENWEKILTWSEKLKL